METYRDAVHHGGRRLVSRLISGLGYYLIVGLVILSAIWGIWSFAVSSLTAPLVATKDFVTTTWKNGKDTASQAWNATTEEASDAWDATTDRLGDAGRWSKRQIDTVVDAPGKAWRWGKDKVGYDKDDADKDPKPQPAKKSEQTPDRPKTEETTDADAEPEKPGRWCRWTRHYGYGCE